MEKNVIVRDSNGRIIGMTYPKRAKGLVKKGRAVFWGEHMIRMINEEDTSMEDNIINVDKVVEVEEKRLFFRPREWNFSKDCKDTAVGERCFITSFDETLAEVYCIGDWGDSLSQIVTKDLILEKYTEYAFSFWLNGGENERLDEICQLHVVFDNDYENRLIFKLNRSFIKPVKHYKGWYLYEIHFTTEDNSYTQLRFVAQRAPMAVMFADAPAAYENIPNEPVPAGRKQRSNLVFENGFPEEPDPFTKGINDFEEKLKANPVTNGEFFDKIREAVRTEVDRAERADYHRDVDNFRKIGEDIKDSVLSEIARAMKNFK